MTLEPAESALGSLSDMVRAVMDTNVFVGAGFNRRSASARILGRARSGGLVLVWTEATRRETRAVLERIPPLDWREVSELFTEQGRFDAEPDLGSVRFVTDPEDRKFAALSLASGAPLVSSDDDLLRRRDRLDVRTPGAFLRDRLGAG